MSVNVEEKFYGKLLEYLEKTEDFLGSEIPKVFDEMVSYFTYTHSLDLSMGLMFMGLMCICIAYLFFKGHKAIKREDFVPIFILGCFTIGLLVSGIMVSSSASKLIKLKVAPRLYLIDYVRKIK